MHDDARQFEAAVHELLAPFKLENRKEIVRELAGHVADRSEALMAAGMSPEEAEEAAVAEIGDPATLCRQIRLSKGGNMLSILRRVILPGFACTLIGSLGDMLAMRLGVRPHVVWVRPGFASLSVPDARVLLAFAVAGAVAALLSRTQGGSTHERVVAAGFPVLLITCSMAVVIAVDTVWWAFTRPRADLELILLITGCYLVAPLAPFAGASLLGALPFLGNSVRQTAAV